MRGEVFCTLAGIPLGIIIIMWLLNRAPHRVNEEKIKFEKPKEDDETDN